MSLATRYVKEIYEQRRYWPTWEPNVGLSLGTCGPVVDGVFRPEGNLQNYGIKFDREQDPAPSDTDYSSGSGLKLEFQTKAGSQAIPNIPQGTAGLRVTFTSKRAIVVAAKGAVEHRIADVAKLRRDVLESAQRLQGVPDRWFVVTHLVSCANATVILAKGSGATFAVSANADFSAGVVDLANAQLGLNVQLEDKIGYKMLAKSGATPLFRGIRLKRSLLGTQKLQTLGPGDVGDQLESQFEELTPETAEI